MQNWAGNYTYRAVRVERPTTTPEVTDVVRRSDRVRAVGTRHSFNAVADAPGGVLVSTERLNRIGPIDATARTVTVEPGVTYGQLGPALHAKGWAVPNLASLPHISVGGAVATGTHGSGGGLGCLSTAVAAVDLVTVDGSVRSFRRGDADFAGVVVSCGQLGVVTGLTLDLVPTFDLEQTVVDRVPFGPFVEHLDRIVGSVYSISGFTDWRDGRFTQVWLKAVAGRPPFDLRHVGGTPADRQRHPLEGRAGNVASDGAGGEACTAQLGVAGPWHERLPHFRLAFTPSSGEEIQSEYFVSQGDVGPALTAVAGLADVLGPVLQVSEVRFVAADDLWLSMCYGRPGVGLHFTWRKDPAAVAAVLPAVEAALAPFAPRPHWGKMAACPAAAYAERYPRWGAFADLAARLDPLGKLAGAIGKPTTEAR